MCTKYHKISTELDEKFPNKVANIIDKTKPFLLILLLFLLVLLQPTTTIIIIIINTERKINYKYLL